MATKKAVKKKAAKKKKAKKKPKQTGRPLVEIPWERVIELSHAGCSGTQIADLMDIHPQTLYKACERDHKMAFSVYSRQKKDSGVALIKESHYKLAIDGNVSAQIFSLKNRAGQADKPLPEKTSNKGSILDTMDRLMDMGKEKPK